AAITALLAVQFIPGNWYIILAAVAAVLAGVVTEKHAK
ncbi:MAG: hypothetical protein FD169_2043, partial [Bacillota bacterium]